MIISQGEEKEQETEIWVQMVLNGQNLKEREKEK